MNGKTVVNLHTYGDNNWKDKLTSYNGQSITYDAIGNPLSYRDGMTMEWTDGRNLKQITTSDGTTEFKYNSDGLRTYKSNSDYTTYYYYDSNNNMIALRKAGTVMYFYYDSQGNATSFSFEGMKYFYIKSQQGNVEKIINKNGDVVVKYFYDDWGNLISMTDTTSSGYGIGSFNPYRYRGYIYDDETGLYYLRSRYYDPQTGRFINADSPAYTDTNSGTPLSTNMFAYCENNAVNYIDLVGSHGVVIRSSPKISKKAKNAIKRSGLEHKPYSLPVNNYYNGKTKVSSNAYYYEYSKCFRNGSFMSSSYYIKILTYNGWKKYIEDNWGFIKGTAKVIAALGELFSFSDDIRVATVATIVNFLAQRYVPAEEKYIVRILQKYANKYSAKILKTRKIYICLHVVNRKYSTYFNPQTLSCYCYCYEQNTYNAY